MLLYRVKTKQNLGNIFDCFIFYNSLAGTKFVNAETMKSDQCGRLFGISFVLLPNRRAELLRFDRYHRPESFGSSRY